MTTNDLPIAAIPAPGVAARTPSAVGAIIGGALVVLSGVAALVLAEARWGVAFGRLPYFDLLPPDVHSTVGGYVVNAAWILVGVLMMISVRRRIVLVATLGTLFSCLFLFAPTLQSFLSFIQPTFRQKVNHVLFIGSFVGAVLITLAFGLAIALGAKRASSAPKILSIVAMSLGTFISISGYVLVVYERLIRGWGISQAFSGRVGLDLLIPLLVMTGWIVLIASVKSRPPAAQPS